jgi:hypothetical protein
MITLVVAFLAAVLLLAGRWRSVPGVGEGIERFVRWISPFEVVVGVVAIVLGVLELLSLEGILLVLAGLVLAVSALRAIPSVGPSLGRLGSALNDFRLVIGILLLLIVVLDVVMLLTGRLGHARLR